MYNRLSSDSVTDLGSLADASSCSPQVRLIDPAADKRWDSFVQRQPHGCLYHQSRWAELIRTTYGFETRYLALESANVILAAVPLFLVRSWFTGKRLVSLPFSDYCNPLVRSSDDFALLLRQAQQVASDSGAKQVELRYIGSDAPPASGFVLQNRSHVNHILDLSEPLEIVKAKFHKNQVLRNLRKAQKEGVQLVAAQTEDDMRLFYGLYLRTRRQNGLPAMPFKFFRNLWRLLFPRKMLHVLLALHASRPVAGIVLARDHQTMFYLYGGSNASTRVRGASQLLLWQAIQMAHASGLAVFDFGRTAVNNQGLLEFKRNWGTVERTISTFTWSETQVSCSLLLNRRPAKRPVATAVFRRMPLPVLRLAGHFIYKHIG